MENKIEIMTEGGKKLALVKNALRDIIKEGVTAAEIEDKANDLIDESGGKASFKMVPGYRWATCVNVNDGVVHGIPHQHIVLKKGDVVSVDVGLYFENYHTDTSFTVAIKPDVKTKRFLRAGEEALNLAIKQAKDGARVYDISKAIEDTLNKYGYYPIRALVGHGVGKELHMPPQIPCFTYGKREDSPKIKNSDTIAIEVMYSEGNPDVYVDGADGWTISTRDGKIASLFEETVAVTADGPLVLTALENLR